MKIKDSTIVVSFSGGKDSVTMLDLLVKQYPGNKMHVVFADTGWEHPGAEEWSRDAVKTISGLPLHVVRNVNKDFFDMVRHRQKFPSPSCRQCTSDLKRDPIYKWIRNNVKEFNIINAMGLRAAESRSRAKMNAWKHNKRLSNSRREVVDWLPIHTWSDESVYTWIKDHDLPLHPVYGYLDRFSCRVCIFSTDDNIRQIAIHDPQAIEKIAEIEQEIGFTMHPTKSILDRI